MPIIDMQRRLREAGRIRIGAKTTTKSGKVVPTKLTGFRFTSQDEASIRAVAEAYGGDAKKWEDAPLGDQWEVMTASTAIDIILVPSGLGFTQWYEMWSGGGCKRRCDGERDVISDGPCVCTPEDRECRPHSRLSVILTKIQGIGVWRLDTQGWNAAMELRGAIDLLEVLGRSHNMVPARLLLTQRASKKPGEQTLKFAVPVIDLNVTVSELTAGSSAPALTPIAAEPTPSVIEQAAAVAEMKPRSARQTSAQLPASGLAPRGADVDDDGVVEATSKDVSRDEAEARSEAMKALSGLIQELPANERASCQNFITKHCGSRASMDIEKVQEAATIAAGWPTSRTLATDGTAEFGEPRPGDSGEPANLPQEPINNDRATQPTEGLLKRSEAVVGLMDSVRVKDTLQAFGKNYTGAEATLRKRAILEIATRAAQGTEAALALL